MTIALARWPLHQLVALRALPTCGAAQTGAARGAAARCARIVTRPFTLPSASLEVNADGQGGGEAPSARERAGPGGGGVGGDDDGSAVIVELLSAGARPDGGALGGLGAANALPIVGNALRAHVWAQSRSSALLALVGGRARAAAHLADCLV